MHSVVAAVYDRGEIDLLRPQKMLVRPASLRLFSSASQV